MPLRSVEAATRDDAIAAAREQFGVSARVVGVRRVRSGGVLGFFATERYVAEVDPDPAARPAVPVPAPRTGERRAVQDPVRESARESAREAAREWTRGATDGAEARRAVPARNASAAWAEARVAAPARPGPSDDDRVDEIAGLLTAAPEPARYAPSSPARPTRAPEPAARPAVVRTPAVRPAWSELLAGASAPAPVAETPAPAPAAPAPEPPAGPSPFTAALARMVAGDRDVQQAVEDALAVPADERTADIPGSWPTGPGPERDAQTSVPSSVAHQEEEPVEPQDWTPSSPPVVDPPAAWTPSPEPVAPRAVSREESIAEVLRAALAQGRSDEALAGILRKVMDGASPAMALAEPVVAEQVVADVAEQLVADVAAPEPEAAREPVEAVLPEAEPLPVPQVADEADAAVPADDAAAEPAGPLAARPPEPVPGEAAMPAPVRSGSELGWDDPVSSSLWGDPVAPVAATGRATETVVAVPVVAEVAADQVVVADPVAEETEVTGADAVADVAEEPVAEQVVAGSVAAQAAADETAADEIAADEIAAEEAVAEEAVEEPAAELSAFLSPVLARTASDPAPLSLDATSVMPPLSLLPPLPSSRQRGGRPPVPPATGRSSAGAARPAPERPTEPAAPDTGRFESLATVTRLPLGPIAEPTAPAVEEAPSAPTASAPTAPAPTAPAPTASEPVATRLPEPATPRPVVDAEPATSEVPAAAAAPATVEAPHRRRDTAVLAAVAAPRARVERARPAAAARPAAVPQGGILDRLAALGLAGELLDATFTADLAARGTYAALTRMLAGRLPETPEVPAGAGDVLVVVGPGVEALRAARALAASLRLDPDRVQWATRGELAGLAPAGSRMTTIETALDRRHDAVGSGTLTIVAVDAGLRTDAYWTAQMLAIWSPVAVWAVVEATRKPEDLQPWVEGLPRVDALMVQDTDLSADPAAVLHRVALPLGLPVAVVDGGRATPHRWASLLCERLETPTA